MSNSLGVLIVTNTLKMGGAESYSLQLYGRLKAEGIPVKYLSFGDNTELVAGPFKSIVSDLTVVTSKSFPKFLDILSKIPFLLKLISKENITAVFCSQPQSALPFWIIRMLFNRKLKVFYTTMHTSSIADAKERILWKLKLPLASTKLIALSNYLRDDLEKTYKIKHDQIVVNRLPVDCDKFFPQDKQKAKQHFGINPTHFIVGQCARLTPVKGIALYIEVFKHLSNYDEIKAVVFGEGPQRKELEYLIGQSSLEDNVRLPGATNENDRAINCFDLFLQTGEGPNMGLSLTEALSCGIPIVIATRNSEEVLMAQDTLLNRECGSIVSADPQDIANEILRIYSDKTLADKMGQEARKLAVEEYSWTKHITTIKGLLK